MSALCLEVSVYPNPQISVVWEIHLYLGHYFNPYAYRCTGSASESGDLATVFIFSVSGEGGMMLPGGVAVNSVQFEMES
jgi:hypothetical protein